MTVFDPAVKALCGSHRVQRVPKSEKNGRRHSSTVNLVWIDEGSESNTPTLNRTDVREEFIRTSGKGGQRRNKVETACRLTHVPTGIQVVADQERQQAQNRKIAWDRLETMLLERSRNAADQALNDHRKTELEDYRSWSWCGWRDEVKSDRAHSSMSKALSGRLGPLLK